MQPAWSVRVYFTPLDRRIVDVMVKTLPLIDHFILVG